MGKVFVGHAGNRLDDEHVGGAELPVDHRAIADIGANPQIAFDQRRQGVLKRFQEAPQQTIQDWLQLAKSLDGLPHI